MSETDLGELMKKAQEMQSRMAEVQRELAQRSVEGTSGGGMVRAVATGELRIKEIRIDPEILSSGDQAMLEDLIAAAVNAALGNAQRMVQEELQKAAATNPLQIKLRPS